MKHTFTSIAAATAHSVPALASAVLLSGLLAGCTLWGGLEKGRNPEDSVTTANVEALLRQHPDLGPPDEIYIETRNHVVYLSGLVATPLQSDSAVALAQEVPGVARVVSRVAVEQ